MLEKIKNLKDLKEREFLDLKEKSQHEAYVYFDENIRSLPKDEQGNFLITKEKFYDNDVDAFRHAYVSGMFTIEHNSLVADLAGWYNEYKGENSIQQQNMDFWNNSVGRKYGRASSGKLDLAQNIQNALKNGELIIDLDDTRVYDGLRPIDYDPDKPLMVIQESNTGENEYFLDQSNGDLLSKESLVALIRQGIYPGYTILESQGKEFPMSKADKSISNNLG